MTYLMAALSMAGCVETAEDASGLPHVQANGARCESGDCDEHGELAPLRAAPNLLAQVTTGCRTGNPSFRAVDMGAYPTSIENAFGGDWYYVAWVWRNSSDASSTHSLSIARSKDYKSWFNSCGTPLSLPLTFGSAEVIDSVPPGGGLLNSRFNLGFDATGKPVVSYMKYDENGITQVYNARLEAGGWTLHRATQWTVRMEFGGGGSLPADDTFVTFGAVSLAPDNQTLIQTLRPALADSVGSPRSGTWILAPATLAPIAPYSASQFPTSRPVTVRPPQWNALEAPPASGMSVIARASSEARDWIPLRGDWNGDGVRSSGLYDMRRSTFFLKDAGSSGGPRLDLAFRYGSKGSRYVPLIGDWDANGTQTIGLYSEENKRFLLKNSNAAGPADLSVTAQNFPGGAPTGFQYYRPDELLPSQKFFVKYEAMGANRDAARDCDGDGTADSDPALAANGCSNMLSNLYVFSYDEGSDSWSKELLDRVWGGASTGFDFMTYKNVQLIAYYNADRHITLARRVLGSAWEKRVLPTVFRGWDNHNYLTLAVDDDDRVHLAGNMHVSPLVYYRGTTGAAGIAAMAGPLPMTGQSEQQTTYPKFDRGPQGEFLFTYRSGSSGAGLYYFNVYNHASKSWSRFLPAQLIDGLQ
jgi:hypothetical protein